MNETPPQQCRLASIAGDPQECPEELCPFWESGGAALPGRCAFEPLDLADNPEVACVLLSIRRTLEQARTCEEEHEARRLFYRALNQGQGE